VKWFYDRQLEVEQSEFRSTVEHLSGAIMDQGGFIPVATNARLRNNLVERAFSRQPPRVDADVARSLESYPTRPWSIQDMHPHEFSASTI
jgi:hypothetical protein